ncbi:MAG: flagellar motor protein MotB [Proteobacteria bacterium]|nr:flagellar motor protein MotB [Pseudomonadota bacterium]
MGKNRKRADESPAINSNAWMVTFSDLVCLMLTFFVMLLTMSSLDKKAIEDTFSYLQTTPGVVEYSGYGKNKAFSDFIKTFSDNRDKLVLSKNQIDGLFESFGGSADSIKNIKTIKNISKLINLKEDDRGLVLSFQENILFESGQTAIRKENSAILDLIATAIAFSSNDILIMGHTDDVPLNRGGYESNWELSVERGLSALNYFINNRQLPPSRFYVGGYGSYRPMVQNSSPENRLLNRRVEIIFRTKEEL